MLLRREFRTRRRETEWKSDRPRRRTNKKRAGPGAGRALLRLEAGLFYLAFLEFHMLAQHGIVFLHRELLRHGAGIFLRHVEEPRIAGAVQADFCSRRLR